MAVDRKQQMKEITERLEQGVKDIFTSEMYTTYLRTMAKFHNYSFNNTLLIAMQRPDATLVAGFNAWKNKFNRYVKKGEKGIQIIAPAPIKEVEEREKIDKDTGLAVLNENGEPEMERVEYVVPRFRVTTVFDVSQTDGEPIPSLEVNELTASVKDYALLTAAIEQVSPVPMRFDEIEGDAKGYYSDADKEICIQVGMGESQTIKTMIHEVAHAMLHNSDLMKQHGEEKDRLTKETEAESIAFTVCSALGIDTSDYSFPYVASWASGKEMKELKDSMDTIRLTAADFLEKLEAAIAERSTERMTAMQYAEKLIANKEQEKTIFDDEQRNLIVNFAFKLDDRAATEELVNGLAAALAEDDKEEVNRLMYDAQEKIENLPDGMIGLSEMHDYGYLKDDVLPLTKEGAREWHRLGERIYPLFRDGTAGDYVSQEEIELHDGIFGIRADAWDAILLEQREDYAEDEYARPDFKLTVINREQALRLYDEGKQIYLVRISPWPILVTAREEIERGSDTFQIAIADLEQERSMTEQENMLLYGSEKQFGIYQITERDPEHNYRFMGLDYVQKKDITVSRADYDLIYTAPLTEKDTLDGIYERFNIQRPADFTGHSLSVSDVVVLNDGSTVKAYYVDSIGFAELPEFFKERNKDRLVRFNGFFPKPQSGTYLILDEGGYQVAGQKGTWLVSDEVEVDGQRFVQMRSEQTKNPPPSIILHESGAFVTQTALGFDGEATRKMSAFLQGPKPELLHHQKFFENGTAERAKESGTEQNYNMIDGCVNNVPQKPRRIGGRWSVLDRLHIKQAERRQKDNTPQQEQERSRKS